MVCEEAVKADCCASKCFYLCTLQKHGSRKMNKNVGKRQHQAMATSIYLRDDDDDDDLSV